MTDQQLEERARALLTAAAETVDVAPTTIAPPPRRLVWPILAAAAAVVLVVGLVTVLSLGGGPRPAPAPAPPGEVAVPQTLWMTEAQAARTLAAAGLRAEVHRDPTCAVPHGRVTRSHPASTAQVGPGATITLSVAVVPAAADCAFPRGQGDAFALLDLARFGSGLRLAPEVEAYVGGERMASLTAGEAADPRAWGGPSPLSELVSAVSALPEPRQNRVPFSVLRDRGDAFACGPQDPPPGLAGRPSTVISLSPEQVDGLFGCRWWRIYRDEQGRVDAITVAANGSAVATDAAPEPEPTGPGQPTAALRAVAQMFAAYTRGGEPPAFAPEVRLLLGNRPVATVTGEQAADPATWLLPCTSYGEASCPIDALLPLRRNEPYAVTGTVARRSSACHTVVGALPPDLGDPDALAQSVSVSVPEPDSCISNWEIQLWLDGEDRIQAANFVAGGP